VQQDTLGHRGRTGDPLYGVRRVLQRGAEHLSATAYGRLLAGLDAGDLRGEVAAAWIACQELRHLYAAPIWTGPGVGCTRSMRPVPPPACPSSFCCHRTG